VSLVFAELLREQVAGIAELSPAQIATLEAHYNLMVRWNKTLNLTKVTDPAEAVARHYVESLFLGAHLPVQSLRIADIGSGAGFPGFPVAILRQDCEVTLIESHQRKAVFLKEASRGLGNLRVIAERAEEVADRFVWIISRAVSYEDLSAAVKVLAPNVALLTGDEAPPQKWGWRWEPAIVVPGSKSRFLRLGMQS
jgi:16S rRNA (guanine(527)-N(7))-methyltransferase RsmG